MTVFPPHLIAVESSIERAWQSVHICSDAG